MKSRNAIIAVWVFSDPCEAFGAVTVLDNFDQYPVSGSAMSTVIQDVELPFTTRRAFAFLPGGVGSQWAQNQFTTGTVAGTLSYTVVGSSTLDSRPLGLALVYSNSREVQSLVGYTGFVLGFSGLSGVGSLYLEFGSSLGLDGVQRINLTGSGEVFYPTSSIYANPGHTPSEFTVLNFVFEARTPEFSFTLDEIRLVPEPGSAACFLAAGAAGLSVRRRRPIVPTP